MISEKNIVISQINNLANKFYSFDSFIYIVNNINNKNNKIGEKIKFSYENYYDNYIYLVNNQKIHIILQDGSIISFYYKFSSNDDIIEHSLYYIPAPSEDVKNYYDGMEKDIDIRLLLYKNMENYIRIDYDPDSQRDYNHSKVHFHFGIKNETLRFPSQSKWYPEEFVFFVLKYIYGSEEGGLNNLSFINNKKSELSECEEKRIFIHNNYE